MSSTVPPTSKTSSTALATSFSRRTTCSKSGTVTLSTAALAAAGLGPSAPSDGRHSAVDRAPRRWSEPSPSAHIHASTHIHDGLPEIFPIRPRAHRTGHPGRRGTLAHGLRSQIAELFAAFKGPGAKAGDVRRLAAAVLREFVVEPELLGRISMPRVKQDHPSKMIEDEIATMTIWGMVRF